MMENRSTLKPRSTRALATLLLLATTDTVSSAALRGADDVEGYPSEPSDSFGKEFANVGGLYESRIQRVGHEDSDFLGDFQEQLHRALPLSPNGCLQEAAEVEYFDIEIGIEAEATPTNCKYADAILLGRDINHVIHDYGVDVAEEYENVVFAAAVCPKPSSESTTTSRKLGLLLSSNKFIFSGGGQCGSYTGPCDSDDYDRRQLASQWFLTTFKPELEQALADHIMTELVPKYEGCLGENPTINVVVEGKTIEDLTGICSHAGGEHAGTTNEELEYLKSYHHNTFMLNPPKSKCGQCTKLDWSVAGDGTVLEKGDYVAREWQDTHGVMVRAFPSPQVDGQVGYAPDDQARILDTSNPGPEAYKGSPNEKCPGGGPGKGRQGEPGTPGENCYPLGNVLIIQEGNVKETNDFHYGGTIRFDFEAPVFFADIGIMEVLTTSAQRLIFTFANGSEKTFGFVPTGRNGARRFMANLQNVVALEVYIHRSGAITEMNYCPMCLDQQQDELVVGGGVTSGPTKCVEIPINSPATAFNRKSNRVIHANGGDTNIILQNERLGSDKHDDFEFKKVGTTSNQYQIRNLATNKYMVAQGTRDKDSIRQSSAPAGSDGLGNFCFDVVTGTSFEGYRIRNVASNYYVTVRDWRTQAATNILQTHYSDDYSQQWFF